MRVACQDDSCAFLIGSGRFGEALAGGARADRLGLAFGAGYRAALRALAPAVGERRAALCATEQGSAHPKAIATRVLDGRVTGRKSFVTFGPEAELLLVIARTPEGPLRCVAVEASAPGVALEPLPPTPFAPEIPHAAVVLDGAPGSVLSGDGYDDYLKPFRTVEDIHVFGAALAYGVALARRSGWPAEPIARLAAVVAALATLAAADPRARATHLALGGALALGRELLGGADFSGAPVEERARWERDRPLFAVAEKARALRFAGAAEALGLTSRA